MSTRQGPDPEPDLKAGTRSTSLRKNREPSNLHADQQDGQERQHAEPQPWPMYVVEHHALAPIHLHRDGNEADRNEGCPCELPAKVRHASKPGGRVKMVANARMTGQATPGRSAVARSREAAVFPKDDVRSMRRRRLEADVPEREESRSVPGGRAHWDLRYARNLNEDLRR